MFNTFFEKKTLYASITGLFVGLILLGCPFFVSAYTTFLEDNFESYNYGALSGQGNWYSAMSANVVSDKTFTGTHSIYVAGGGTGVLYDDESLSTDGITSFYFYLRADSDMAFRADSIDNGEVKTWQFYIKTADCLGYYCDFSYWNSGWQFYDTVHTFAWHFVEIRWHIVGSEFKWAFNLDSKGWSADMNTQGQSYQYINRIRFEAGNGLFWFDDISGEVADCNLYNCVACTTGSDCINAGCTYEWLPTYERYECHTTWIAYVSGCGLGYGCYGCNDQSACESATPVGTCEWVNKGYGISCYPVEEVPPEATWEEPELEDCDELSGVEKWLCVIKNFIAGIFMPTQEKIDILRLTIDNFKMKFPFNYANSLSAFFQTIKTSLNTPKEIPVEIFNNSGNLNFDFLEATGTIGGTSETIKNILFDFTTALIVIAFLFWIISFIKRIF